MSSQPRQKSSRLAHNEGSSSHSGRPFQPSGPPRAFCVSLFCFNFILMHFRYQVLSLYQILERDGLIQTSDYLSFLVSGLGSTMAIGFMKMDRNGQWKPRFKCFLFSIKVHLTNTFDRDWFLKTFSSLKSVFHRSSSTLAVLFNQPSNGHIWNTQRVE